MRKFIVAALAATSLVACGDNDADPDAYETSAEDSGRRYMQAINDIARLDDKQFDEDRKPGELLAFAQIERGDVVGDYIMGAGYVTRLLATAVGANGKVYAFQPEEFIASRPQFATEQDEAVAPYTDDEGNYRQVVPLRGALAEPGWPEKLDTIITVMNWHNLYRPEMPEATPETVAAMMFDSLKPGGTLIVIDHLATDGAGIEAAEGLNRMDASLAGETLTGAGFVVEERSDLYSQPDDPRTADAATDEIRGRTDQFAWRLRKPG